MRKALIVPAFTAGFAALILAGATPASAMPGATTLDYGQANVGIVHDVAKSRYSKKYNKKYGYSNRRNAYRPYAYNSPSYGYRSYGYQPYSYGYRPYAYADPYGYRRPGIRLQFGY